MKLTRSLKTIVFGLALVGFTQIFTSCGTTVHFGKDGNITVTPPSEPIVIPTK